MPRFRPDIKPPCWGSFDAVSYAVRVNAEKLGIDPAKLALCMPLWERGGLAPLDYVGGVRGVMTTATWADDGIFASAGNFYVASPLLNKSTPAVTFLALMRKVTVVNTVPLFSNRTAWSSAHGHEIVIESLKYSFRFGDGSSYELKSGTIDFRFIDNPKNDARLYGYTYDAGALRLYADFYPGKRAHDVLTTTRTSIASAGTNAMKMCAGTGASASVGMLFGALTAIPHTAVERLATEPYALIMPVARPLYFDLGATTQDITGPAIITAESTLALLGQKGADGTATVTTSATVGMDGAKGATFPLNIVGTASIDAGGQKNATSPATVAAQSDLGMGGIKTILGLDKEGPAVFSVTSDVSASGVKESSSPAAISAEATLGMGGVKTILGIDKDGPAVFAASASIGMGGVKGAISQAWIGADSAVVAAGVKGGVGSAAWLAAVGFLAGRGPDVMPITADEVARVVRAAGRMKTVTAAARAKQVRYAIS